MAAPTSPPPPWRVPSWWGLLDRPGAKSIIDTLNAETVKILLPE